MPGILDILSVVGTVVDRVIPDPKDKMELQEKLAEIADHEAQRDHDENMGQIEVDKIEAANPNMFVAGWRPFIGWTGGGALAYNVIVAPDATSRSSRHGVPSNYPSGYSWHGRDAFLRQDEGH
jgi:hypothetical protein